MNKVSRFEGKVHVGQLHMLLEEEISKSERKESLIDHIA